MRGRRDMSDVYAIGDLHFGHKNILQYRDQFPTTSQHDATIMNNIRSVCGKRDTLWLLGDCFFSWESIAMAKEISEHVLAVNWVFGNHDTDSSERQKIVRTIIACKYVNQVHGLCKTKYGWMSHAPIHPDELRGKVNIHGHMHGRKINDERYIGVSCEQVGYTPLKIS
jgi:calcineurin-like phosphoesterase family protein